MNETPLESAAEFLLRKRGRVRAKWIVSPVALLGIVSMAVAVGVGREHRPEFVPYTLGLYGCTAFFVHAYVTAWRAGSFVWRYSALFVALTFYGVLSMLHADDAVAWVVWSESGARPRPPQPLLFLPVTLNIISGVLLTLHAFFLGLGSRAPTPTELTRIVKANSSGIMSMSTFDDDAAREVVLSAFAQIEEDGGDNDASSRTDPSADGLDAISGEVESAQDSSDDVSAEDDDQSAPANADEAEPPAESDEPPSDEEPAR